jgi:hypothetical protein
MKFYVVVTDSYTIVGYGLKKSLSKHGWFSAEVREKVHGGSWSWWVHWSFHQDLLETFPKEPTHFYSCYQLIS